MFSTCLESPIGLLLLKAGDFGLRSIQIIDKSPSGLNTSLLLEDTKAQLQDYFDGKRRQFDIVVDWQVGTAFQQKVWRALKEIPYGKTISYARLSLMINKPKAVRAVGAANGKNPIPIIIPCHRVIGSDGSLTGYYYGNEIKKQLLAVECPSKYAVEQAVLFD